MVQGDYLLCDEKQFAEGKLTTPGEVMNFCCIGEHAKDRTFAP